MDTLITYGLIALIVCLASFVRGTAGFGLAMTSLPFLTLFLSYQDTIVLLVFLNFLFSIFHLTRSKGTISKNNFLLTLIFGVIGVTIGVALLKELNQNLLKAIAGIMSFTLPASNATTKNASDATAATPPASPSMISMILNAFVIPTTHKIVSIIFSTLLSMNLIFIFTLIIIISNRITKKYVRQIRG